MWLPSSQYPYEQTPQEYNLVTFKLQTSNITEAGAILSFLHYSKPNMKLVCIPVPTTFNPYISLSLHNKMRCKHLNSSETIHNFDRCHYPNHINLIKTNSQIPWSQSAFTPRWDVITQTILTLLKQIPRSQTALTPTCLPKDPSSCRHHSKL